MLRGDISPSLLCMQGHRTHIHWTTKWTNGLNEELIVFLEAGCNPSASFKFLGSVKSSQREDEDRYREREKEKKMDREKQYIHITKHPDKHAHAIGLNSFDTGVSIFKCVLRLQCNTVCIVFTQIESTYTDTSYLVFYLWITFYRGNGWRELTILNVPGWSWWACPCVPSALKACMPGRHPQSRSCSCWGWCDRPPSPCQTPAGDLQENHNKTDWLDVHVWKAYMACSLHSSS